MEEIRFRIAKLTEGLSENLTQGKTKDKKGWLILAPESKEGSFTSSPLDSGIQGCQWHRAVIKAEIPKNAIITLKFAASDDKQFNSNPDFGEAQVILSGDSRDALIQDKSGEPVSGRFLKIKAELHCDGGDGSEIGIGLIKAYYPRSSYLRYLPAVYQKDEESRRFLERFLSIFESSLSESNEAISNIQRYFDPMSAPEEFVPWLASWLSLDLYDLAGERNRNLILQAAKLYRWKGTATGLAKLAEILTGKPCIIKEYGNNIFQTYGAESYEEYDPTRYEKNGFQGMRFHRKISRTVDTGTADKKNLILLQNIGTYRDELHYIAGKAILREYYPGSVGLFIIYKGSEPIEKSEIDLLYKIIESYLPVFVKVRIEAVQEFEDSFKTTLVKDEYSTRLKTDSDRIEEPVDSYRSCTDWDMIYTFMKGWDVSEKCHTPKPISGNPDTEYRTFFDQIRKYKRKNLDLKG